MSCLIRTALLKNKDFSTLSKDDQDRVVKIVVFTAEERIKKFIDEKKSMSLD